MGGAPFLSEQIIKVDIDGHKDWPLTYSTYVLFWEGELMGDFLGEVAIGDENCERMVSPQRVGRLRKPRSDQKI